MVSVARAAPSEVLMMRCHIWFTICGSAWHTVKSSSAHSGTTLDACPPLKKPSRTRYIFPAPPSSAGHP